MSRCQQKIRGKSGRIREKAGNCEHRPEGKPEDERTNRRKSWKSGALAGRKAGDEADEPKKKQEIVSIDLFFLRCTISQLFKKLFT